MGCSYESMYNRREGYHSRTLDASLPYCTAWLFAYSSLLIHGAGQPPLRLAHCFAILTTPPAHHLCSGAFPGAPLSRLPFATSTCLSPLPHRLSFPCCLRFWRASRPLGQGVVGSGLRLQGADGTSRLAALYLPAHMGPACAT